MSADQNSGTVWLSLYRQLQDVGHDEPDAKKFATEMLDAINALIDSGTGGTVNMFGVIVNIDRRH